MSQLSHARQVGKPTWEIAQLFPTQGQWCEEEYLALDGNHLVELSNGFLEVLPMPTTSHQLMLSFLYGLFLTHVSRHNLGTVLFAALRVRLWARTFREPDIVLMAKEHADRIHDDYWDGADLALEIVSGSKKDRNRDLVVKRREYAKAGIREYWIVDPDKERIVVLRLAGKRYVLHGKFGKDETATSQLLPGFSVKVAEVLSKRLQRSARRKISRRSRS
jgi:Uma2 family endonuclease